MQCLIIFEKGAISNSAIHYGLSYKDKKMFFENLHFLRERVLVQSKCLYRTSLL
jgi:hypothetical protein